MKAALTWEEGTWRWLPCIFVHTSAFTSWKYEACRCVEYSSIGQYCSSRCRVHLYSSTEVTDQCWHALETHTQPCKFHCRRQELRLGNYYSEFTVLSHKSSTSAKSSHQPVWWVSQWKLETKCIRKLCCTEDCSDSLAEWHNEVEQSSDWFCGQVRFIHTSWDEKYLELLSEFIVLWVPRGHKAKPWEPEFWLKGDETLISLADMQMNLCNMCFRHFSLISCLSPLRSKKSETDQWLMAVGEL